MKNVKGRNKKNVSELDLIRRNAGVSIIFVVCVCLVIFFFGGMIWSENIKFNNIIPSTSGLEDNIKLDAKKLFDSTYYDAIENVSGLAFNTKWIELCPNSQTKINNELYVRVCDSRFSAVSDILNYFENIFSKDFTLSIIEDKYIDYDNHLYVKPFIQNKNESYLEMDSYTVRFKTNNKISYIVKSKYKLNNNEFEYKENLFEIEKNENVWVVSKFDLPM